MRDERRVALPLVFANWPNLLPTCESSESKLAKARSWSPEQAKASAGIGDLWRRCRERPMLNPHRLTADRPVDREAGHAGNDLSTAIGVCVAVALSIPLWG